MAYHRSGPRQSLVTAVLTMGLLAAGVGATCRNRGLHTRDGLAKPL